MSRERRRFNLGAILSLLFVGAIAFLVLLRQHHAVATAVFLGFCWGIGPQIAAWGLADLIAPRWVIRWRERLMVGNRPAQAAIGDWVSDRLRAGRLASGHTRETFLRVRLLGAFLLAFAVVFIAVLIWLPPRIDQMVTTAFPR